MKRPITRAGLAAALVYFLTALVGGDAAAADRPPVAPPPPAAPPAESPLPPVYPTDGPTAQARPHKLRLRVPFTPINEDGSAGKRTLITITVEGDDRDQALEAADQVIDRLIVRPALDEVWDEIDQRIDEAIRSGGLPSLLPPPIPMPPGPASRQVQRGTENEPMSPVRTRAGVEITAEGLLESFDGAGAALGIPSLLSLFSRSAPDPNQGMEELLFQSMDTSPISDEWKQLNGGNDQPSHMTYTHVHGSIGP